MKQSNKARDEYCTIGPVPINGLVEIMSQLRDQQWTISHVAFSGMIAVQERLSLKQPIPLPSYVVIGSKFFEKDEEFVAPAINLQGGGNANNH